MLKITATVSWNCMSDLHSPLFSHSQRAYPHSKDIVTIEVSQTFFFILLTALIYVNAEKDAEIPVVDIYWTLWHQRYYEMTKDCFIDA